jgi:predicted nuclease with TOPRIM domain
MQSNQPIDDNRNDNIVPLSSPRGSKNGWIYENLRNIFDHFTEEKAETDKRLAAITQQGTATDAGLKELDSKTQNLAISTNRLIHKTNNLAASDELLAKELDSVSASLKASLSELGKRSDKTESGLNSLSEEVGRIGAAARELDSQNTDLVNRTLDLMAADKHLLEETEGLKSRIAQIEPRQESLEDSNGRLLEDTEALTRKTGQLTNHFQKAAWITGGLALVLAIAIGSTNWFSTSEIDRISVGTNEQILALRSDFTADINRLETTGVERTEVEQQIGALQSRIDTKVSGTSALELRTAALSDEVRRLATLNEQLESELGVIKDRMFSPDAPLPGTTIDMSKVRAASWLEAQNPNHYVIQLVSVYGKQDIAAFIAQHQHYLPLEQLSYSKTVHKGRDMYILLFGNYGRFNEAMEKLQVLPSALQRNRPYIRTFRGVQRRMS